VLDLVNRRRGRPHAGGSGQRADGPLAVGQRILDQRLQRQGTVIDVARQYAHPKADPVFHYLVRWDDGQVQALGEAVFDGDYGLEPLY